MPIVLAQVLVTPLFEAFTDIIPSLKVPVMTQIERRAHLGRSSPVCTPLAPCAQK
jgi:hypothetical protein